MAVSVFAALPGCSPKTEENHVISFQVRDSAGVLIAENHADPEFPRLEALETRRIGVVDGDDPYLFSQIYAVAVSPCDTVFVGNSQTGTVRAFSPEGHFLREFGGIGEGPHEVSTVFDLWLSGDTVVVWDVVRPGKTLLFLTSGEFLTSWRGSLQDGTRVIPRAKGEQGWIAEVRSRRSGAGNPGDSIGEPVELRAFDPESRSLGETVFIPPTRPIYETGSGSEDALFRVYGSGFDQRGRFFRTVPEKYEVAVYEASGELGRLVRRSFEPRPIGPADIEEYRGLVQAVLDTITMFGPPGSIDDQVWARVEVQESLPLPTHRSPIRKLMIGSDGFVWAENVESVPPGSFELMKTFGLAYEDFEKGTVWDLFNGDGAFLGQVPLPPRFKPMAVRGTEVTGVFMDDLDVEYVVTYRVGPSVH